MISLIQTLFTIQGIFKKKPNVFENKFIDLPIGE